MGVAKRTWMVLPATLGAALAVVVGAPAATHPTAAVHSAKLSGGSVVFTVDVSVKAKTCKGNVKLSAAGHHWKGAATKSGGACHARIHGKLPKADYGKKLSFKFSFAGKSGTAKLKLSPPAPGGPVTQPTTTPTTSPGTVPGTTDTTPTQTGPSSVPPPGYVNGHWFGNLTSPNGGQIDFTVTNGVIQKNISNTTNGFMLFDCNDGSQTHQMFYSYAYRQTVPVLSDAKFSSEYQETDPPDPEGSGSGQDMHMTVSGELSETAGASTITLGASGTIYAGDGSGHVAVTFTGCHGSATATLYKSP